MSVIFNPATVGGGSGITQLTGDVAAGPGTGSQPATLATVNASVGTWGDATHVGQFTVNAKGLITSASNVVVSGGGGRTVLLATTNYYISHDTGNDANNGSIGSPWATIQHGVDYIAQNLDINNQTVYLNVADSASTYAGATWNHFIGGGNLVFAGNDTTLGNVKVGNSTYWDGSTLGSFFAGPGNSATLIWIYGFDMHPTSGPALDCDGADRGAILLGEPTFTRVTTKNKYSSCQANSYVIVGTIFDYMQDVSLVDGTALNGLTPKGFYLLSNPSNFYGFINLARLSFSGAVTFSKAFAVIHSIGVDLFNSVTGAGTIAGPRFNIQTNGVLLADSLTSLPGTSAGLIVGTLQTTTRTYTGADFFYVDNLPALYTIPNGSGNNWFEGNAGNVSLTGYQNFGTGDQALVALTTGFANTAVASNALQHLTTGSNNFAFGVQALQFDQLDSFNTGIGFNCLTTLGTGGAGSGNNTGNFAAGNAALANMATGSNNVCIGYAVMANVIGSASFNIAIGSGAGAQLGLTGATVTNNNLVGVNCGAHLLGGSSSNTWVGSFQGPSAVVANTITIADGGATNLLDMSLSTFNIWTFSAAQSGQSPTGLHVYNIQDFNSQGLPASIVNYERACLDWSITSNVYRITTQAGGTGVKRLIAIDGFSKAGAPAAGDLPSGSFAVIDDTSGNQTWLVFNKAGTIRKVQLV